MSTFAQPSSMDFDSVSVPWNFPYIVAFLQGKPQHFGDVFFKKHPPMDRGKRAKIFAPFDALDGYGDAVRSKNVIYMNKTELDESEKEELNRRLFILHSLTYNRRLAKKNHIIVSITYYVPCTDENTLFGRADIVTATGHEYTKSCMFVRNRYLVDNADLLLAAFDGQPGGTEMTIRYAKQMGIQVCCIKPVIK